MRVSRIARILSGVGSRLPADSDEVANNLELAGLTMDPHVAIGARAAAAAAGILLGLQAGAPLDVILALVLGFAGYRSPDAWIASRVRARRDGIAAALPDAVELLAVCTRAGLNISLALARVAARAPGALGEELRRAMSEIELGVPRASAMARMASRVNVPQMTSVVGALASADRFGASVAGSLETLASDLRKQRRRAAEEQARRAPIKILFPLVFLILPAFVLLTVAPLILGTLRSLGF